MMLSQLHLAALLLPLAALRAHPGWPGSTTTDGALPQCHQIRFNITNGDPPALVFNPAMAYDASAGWVVFANAARCHFWQCGLGHHTPLGALAGGAQDALPDLQAAADGAQLWSVDASGLDFARECPHLLADGNASACGAPALAGEADLLALHAEDFRPFVWRGQLLVAHTVVLVPTPGSRPVPALSRVDFATNTLRLLATFADVYQRQSGAQHAQQALQEARWEKNWGYFEHRSELLVLYQLYPCTIVLRLDPHRPEQYATHSSSCYGYGLPQGMRWSGAPPSDWRLSGLPVPWRGGSELLLLAHTVSFPRDEATRRFEHFKHYKHYALRLDTATWRLTHMSAQPLLASDDYTPEEMAAWAFPGALVVGSAHVVREPGSGRERLLLMLVGEGDSRSCARLVHLDGLRWLPLDQGRYAAGEPGLVGPKVGQAVVGGGDGRGDGGNGGSGGGSGGCPLCGRLREHWERRQHM